MNSTSHLPMPANDYGTRIAWCLVITVAAGTFFWAYDAIAHREAPYLPQMTRPARVAAVAWDRRAVVDTPAPDMNSPAIEFAKADVSAALRVANSKPVESKSEPVTTADLVVKKKKRVPVAKTRLARTRPIAPGFNAYAQNYHFSPSLFGGF